jgi:hypothetical protein
MRALTIAAASLAIFLASGAALGDTISNPPSPPPVNSVSACKNSYADDATRATCAVNLSYQAAYYAHNQAMMAIQEEQYRDQISDGVRLFYVVLGIVVIGLGLSVLQFLKSFWFAKKATEAGGPIPPADAPPPDDPTTFSYLGIEIKSSVIGLIILAMSLAFFFLYLKFVYVITPAATTGS